MRLAWFTVLFLCIFGVSTYAVVSSFPLPGGSDPRHGAAAIHESIGVAIFDFVHRPFAWLHSYIPSKAAWWCIWFFWAGGTYIVSALLRRPRWVFTPRHQL